MITPIAHVPAALVFAGHGHDAVMVLTSAAEHVPDVDLTARRGLIVQAWWAGDKIGFCTEEHPDAAPVTVVNLPERAVTDDR